MTDRDARASLWRRLANAALAGVVAALGVAAWESRLLSEPLAGAPLLFGTFAFVWVGLAVAMGTFLWLVLPGVPPAPGALFSLRSRTLAAGLLLGGAGVPLLLVLGAEAALGAFVGEASSGGRGGASAVALVLLLALGSLVGKAALPALGKRLPESLSAGYALLVGLGLGSVLLYLLVSLGDPSGGDTALARFGVLAREELDLGVVAFVLVTAILVVLATVALARVPALVGTVAAVAAVASVLLAARGFDDSVVLTEVEQHTRLGRTALRTLQRLSDRDRDGFGAHFGGGDCDDRNPDVYPGAVDEPANGLDEDCSGADEAPRAVASPGPSAAPSAPSTAEPSGAVPAVPENLNVLLISVDTLRWDLGYMGYERPITPNVDALAARSVVYEKAYSLASYTGKSVGPTLIGRYPSETHRGFLHFNRYPPRDRMLQERLSSAGIRTISVQAHWYFAEGYGLERGFDVLDMSAAPEEDQGEGDKTILSHLLTDAAIKQLEDPANTAKPFFMWVHYLDPHANYVPHPEFSFGSDSRALYDGEIAYTDHHIGRLLKALDERGLTANTAIVFTSDHGEAFGEHGMIRHGFEIWEEIVRVPLVVHVPGYAPGRVTVRRSLIDLAPTVLDLFDVEVEPGVLRGSSWLPDLRNPESAAARPVFIDMPAGPYNGDRQAFIENDIKITTSNTRTMGVFDLSKDPGEQNNLMRDAQLAQRVHARFLEFRRGLEPVKVTPR